MVNLKKYNSIPTLITLLVCSVFIGCKPSSSYESTIQQKGDKTYPVSDSRFYGLNECVRKEFKKANKEVYSFLKLSKTLGDYKDSTSIKTYSDWLDLVDLLYRELIVTYHKNDDATTYSRVDYKRLLKDHPKTLKEKWQLAMDFLKTIETPLIADKTKYMVYYGNAYNLVMIEFLRLEYVENPDLKTMDTKKMFDTLKFPLKEGEVTLNNIEYSRLNLSSSKGLDYRFHFALVCGAISCPKLRPIALRDDNLELILNENMYNFFNSQQHIEVSEEAQAISELMSWFQNDFKSLNEKYGMESLIFESCNKETYQLRKDTINNWINDPKSVTYKKYLFTPNIIAPKVL